MPQKVLTETLNGRVVYRLLDEDTGASAAILPSYGFNLFDLRLPLAGEVRPVIDAAPDFAAKPANPGRNGVPILFPFPNRIAHGKFDFQGMTYQLPVTHGQHAIHGFALDAPWDVVESKDDAGKAALTGRYQISKQSPGKLAYWPTDAVLEVRYALAGRRLSMTVTVTNPTGKDLPYGFGIHPYFRCPWTADGDAAKTRVTVPASEQWVLDGFIPTGEKRPVDARLDFRHGQAMKGLKLDDVLTNIAYLGNFGFCELEDLALGGVFRLGFDRSIRELVMYTPPGAPNVIAIEPYTQTTDAIHLAARGINGGLRVLGHGKSESLTIVMETVG